MEYGYCPLSFRSVKASDYKKAMLLFYEQNNLTEFKKIFMSQYEYAVNKYFNLGPEVTEQISTKQIHQDTNDCQFFCTFVTLSSLKSNIVQLPYTLPYNKGFL